MSEFPKLIIRHLLKILIIIGAMKYFNFMIKDSPVMYKIKDFKDEKIQGKFYHEELQVIEKLALFRTEKIP